ncbi:conjugal transfer protein TraN [Aeromonas veronii]|uniref:conjugal transfer protein TraN n=1 Tax=Aeromonas veronii TaxID=654 RepID=UPI00406BD115
MQRDGGPYGSAMKNTSLSVLFTYFIVFVFHPAFIAVGLAAMISPGRALAAQSDELYQNLKSKYQLDTPDNDVSKENEVLDIKQKYGKGSGGAEEVIKSLQKYQGQDRAGATVDMGKYQGGNFSSGYQSTYNDAAAGGVGINNLSMPGVSGNNVSVNYAPQGGVKLARDANGNITNTQVGGVKTNDVSSVVGAEASNAETSFGAKNTYNPNNEDDLIREVKSTVSKAQAGGNTSDSVAYRTIMESYRSNKPQNISRDDPAFLGAKSAVDDARLQKGLFDGACKSVTTTTTKQTHYPDWREHRCSAPKKDNYQSCELARSLDVPVHIEGGDGQMLLCGPDCVRIRMGKHGNNYLNGGACSTFNNSLSLKFAENVKLQSAVVTMAEWDDHMEAKLGNQVIFYHVAGALRDPSFPWPTDGQGCELNTEWYMGDGIGSAYAGGYIDVTAQVKKAIASNQDRSVPLSTRVAVGNLGEGHFEITLRFEDLGFKDDRIQIPAGCYDAVLKSDGTCKMDKWQPLDVGTKRLPSTILDLGKPLFPGDTGYLTWRANAEGYYCDPLANNKLVVGDKSFSYEDIKNMPDGCAAEKANPMCIEKSRDCVPGWNDTGTGQCYMEEVVYQCDEGKTVSEIVSNTSNTCGELPCIGTDCSAGAQEVNKDFAQTAGLLQAMSFLSADGSCTAADPSQCKVFPGEQKYCGWAVGVVGALADTNCCVAPQGGPDTLSAAMSAFSIIRSMNWQKIAANASEFTGSTSFNAIYNGVSEFGTTIGNATASAIQAAGEAMTSVSNTVMSSLGQEVAYEGAKVGGGRRPS